MDTMLRNLDYPFLGRAALSAGAGDRDIAADANDEVKAQGAAQQLKELLISVSQLRYLPAI